MRSTSYPPMNFLPEGLRVERQVRPAGEVHHHLDERLVERHDRVPVPGEPRLVGGRLPQRLAEADPHVLHRVVRVDLEVALRADGERHAAVARDLVEHVVEEQEPRRDARLARRERELDGDVGLLRLPRDLPAPRSPPRSALPPPVSSRPPAGRCAGSARLRRGSGARAPLRGRPPPRRPAPATAPGPLAFAAVFPTRIATARQCPSSPSALASASTAGATAASARGVSSSTLIRRRNVATESGEANRAVPAVGRTWLGPAR